MARRPRSAKKPEPFGIPPVRCRATRGPDERGRWYWRAVRYAGGAEVPVWSGWATAEDAARAVGEAIRDGLPTAEAPSNVVMPDRPTVRDALETWMPILRKRPKLPSETLRGYRESARRLLRYADDMILSELRPVALRDLRDRMLHDLAPTSVRAFTVLKLAIRDLRPRGWMIPELEFPRLDRDTVRDKYTPKADEVLQVYWRLPQRAWYRAAYRLLWATGARVGSDLGRLTWGDIDAAGCRLRIPDDSKTGARWVFVDADVMTELVRIRGDKPADARVFPRSKFRQRLQEKIDEALEALAKDGIEIPRWTTHGFRRAAIRAMRRAGVDVLVTARMMGNSPQTIWKHYDEADDDDVREAAAKVRLGAVVRKEKQEREKL